MAEAKVKAEETAVKDENRMVTILIPLERGSNEDVYVSVNQEEYILRRGEQVTVPWYVAELLKNRDRMMRISNAYDRARRNG
jgi:hypothetical protein